MDANAWPEINSSQAFSSMSLRLRKRLAKDIGYRKRATGYRFRSLINTMSCCHLPRVTAKNWPSKE
jgi:hypothetical protein